MQINTFRTKVETCYQVDVWVRTEDLAPKVVGLTCASVGSAHAQTGRKGWDPAKFECSSLHLTVRWIRSRLLSTG